MSDRYWLALATLFYAGAVLRSFWKRGSRLFKPDPVSFLIFIGAFTFHTLFLIQRGNVIGHCPLTNLLEVTAFTSWSIGLAYLIIGPIYRLTLLGVVTAPLLFLMLLASLLFANDERMPVKPMGYALELHASLSIMAYGALGLSALTGIIHLIQDWCLHRKHWMNWLANLPPLTDLAKVQYQLTLLGLLVLTVGMAAGFFVPSSDWVKTAWTLLVWCGYVALLVASGMRIISGRRTAALSILLFAFLLGTFWGINSISLAHRF